MTFTTVINRDDVELDVVVEVSIQPLAKAIDAAPGHASRFAGQWAVEILSVTPDGGEGEIELTDSERASIADEAITRAKRF